MDLTNDCLLHPLIITEICKRCFSQHVSVRARVSVINATNSDVLEYKKCKGHGALQIAVRTAHVQYMNSQVEQISYIFNAPKKNIFGKDKPYLQGKENEHLLFYLLSRSFVVMWDGSQHTISGIEKERKTLIFCGKKLNTSDTILSMQFLYRTAMHPLWVYLMVYLVG